VSAILKHTQKVVYLDDHEMATVYRDKFVTKTVDNVTTSKEVHEVDWDLEQIEKGRLRSLHAEGDQRAAGDDHQRHARPPASTTRESRSSAVST
jgi:hypothetical protein